MLIVQQPSVGIRSNFDVNSVIGPLIPRSAIIRNAEMYRHLPIWPINCPQMAVTHRLEMRGAHVQLQPIKPMLDYAQICRGFADSCKALVSELL